MTENERLTFTDKEMDDIRKYSPDYDCPVKSEEGDLVNQFCDSVCDTFQSDCPFMGMGKKLKCYEDIDTVEEFKALKEKSEEVEIPEPKENKIVAGIMLPNVKGKAVVSLSNLHDILMDITGIETRDKVFEQIYNRNVIIGLRDVIEKWEERRK